MYMIEQTTSYELTLDETVRRLAAAPQVEGIALFGSHSMAHNNPVSDYDLLLLVDAPPVEIFQMLTHIDGRMADIVISTVDTAQHVLTLATPVSIHTAEGMLIHKLWAATIVHDPHARLAQIRQHLHRRPKCTDWLMGTNVEEQYATWFWQNHSLLHIKRMCHSTDSLYLTAADMLLVTGLAGLCRSYFVARQLSWEGEKAALRYLHQCDPEFLNKFQACLGETERAQKIARFEQLLMHALAPIGPLWKSGVAAVYLRDSAAQPARVAEALAFWEGLLTPHGG